MNKSGPPLLICFDGSLGAVRAVEAAGALFPGQPAVVLYLWPGIAAERVRTTSVEGVRQELIEEVRVAARRDAAAVAEEGTRLALDAGLEARPLTVEAPEGTADAIVRMAMKESARAVVVGRGNRARLGSLLLGSVSRSVVDHCPLPVVVIS